MKEIYQIIKHRRNIVWKSFHFKSCPCFLGGCSASVTDKLQRHERRHGLRPVVHCLWLWEFVRSIYILELRVWENQRYLFYCNNFFFWIVLLPSSSLLIQALDVISRINISQVLVKTVTVSWAIILISLSAFIILLIGASGSLWFFEVCWSHSSIWLAQNRTWRQSWANQMHEMTAADLKKHKLPLAPVKRIMRADNDIRMIVQETVAVFAKTCEMFILDMTSQAWINNEEDGRTVQKKDIAVTNF